MKHLLTLLAIGFTFLASAQSNNPEGWSNYDFPFNPDANNDNSIGSEDLLQVLAVYGNEYGYEPPTCDYIASDMEEFFAGILTGTIVIDSLYWEIELTDITTNYYPGCPEVVLDTLVLVRNGMEYVVQNEYSQYEWTAIVGFTNSFSNSRFIFTWYPQTAQYKFLVQTNWIYPYMDLQWFQDGNNDNYTNHELLPLDNLTMNEEGHIIVNEWSGGVIKYYGTNYVFIPYWHYAE